MAEVGAILRKQQAKLGELLSKKTHFMPLEIEGLLSVHRRLQMTPKSNDSNSGMRIINYCINADWQITSNLSYGEFYVTDAEAFN